MPTFEEQFTAFARFTESKSSGKYITLVQSDKWMRQAKVINHKITQADTALAFNKLHRESVKIEDFQKFVDDLAHVKRMDPNEIREKMTNCGPPAEDRSRVESTIMTKVEDPSGYI